MAFEHLSAEQLGEYLRASGKKGLALDIDDTLSVTNFHWFSCMADRCGNPDNMPIQEIMLQYRDVRRVPFWNQDDVEATIQELLISPVFQDSLPIIQGADDAIWKINAIVPIVAYITARPARTHEATRTWLERHGFPEVPITFIEEGVALKDRSVWKARIVKDLYPYVVGIIDDHPHMAEQLAELGYEGQLYLYNHGNTVNSYEGHDAFHSWDEIITHLKERFTT